MGRAFRTFGAGYAAVASSLRGPAVMGAEIPKITAADDLDSDLGFVLNCGKMSAFEREYYYTKNIML